MPHLSINGFILCTSNNMYLLSNLIQVLSNVKRTFFCVLPGLNTYVFKGLNVCLDQQFCDVIRSEHSLNNNFFGETTIFNLQEKMKINL